jgi:predicted dehydrogenase
MSVKFGIVGCGGISRFYFNALKKAGAEVVHVSDINEKAAESYVESFGVRFSVDYCDVVADPEVTAVCVLTGSRAHRDICIQALGAGKDVICEKTMTVSMDEAEEVTRAALDSGQIFFTAYMKRFFPAVKKAKELLPSLGKIFSAHVRAYHMWGNLYELEDDNGFQKVMDNYGGAVLKCTGSHLIDMTLSFLGRPQSVYSHVDYIGNSKVDRKTTALLEYEDGIVVSFETAGHPLTKIGYQRNGWEECFEVSGVNGRIQIYTVKWDEPESTPVLLIHYDNETETSVEYRFDAINPFDLQLQYFYDCLKHRKQGKPSVIDGFNVDVVIGSMEESTQRRTPIQIDWRGL